jgi:quercetin dioxygenase-like cupin family protein
MAIKKISLHQAARRKAPSRFYREIVSHRVLKSKSIALRYVELMPLRKTEPRHPHSHRGMEEVIFVEKGTGKAWVNGKVDRIRTGDTVLVPAGARHMMINTGSAPMILICAFSKGDPEKRYREYPEISYRG